MENINVKIEFNPSIKPSACYIEEASNIRCLSIPPVIGHCIKFPKKNYSDIESFTFYISNITHMFDKDGPFVIVELMDLKHFQIKYKILK
jgi:hypothetical protein